MTGSIDQWSPVTRVYESGHNVSPRGLQHSKAARVTTTFTLTDWLCLRVGLMLLGHQAHGWVDGKQMILCGCTFFVPVWSSKTRVQGLLSAAHQQRLVQWFCVFVFGRAAPNLDKGRQLSFPSLSFRST